MKTRNEKRNRLFAAAVAVALLFSIILSETFIATHFVHECTGSGCPVCQELHMAAAFLQQISAASVLSAVCFFYIISIFSGIHGYSYLFRKNTLISQKVRMDD